MRRSSPAASAFRPAVPCFALAGPLSAPPEMLKSKTAIWIFPQKALSLYYKKRERPAKVSPSLFFLSFRSFSPWEQHFAPWEQKFAPWDWRSSPCEQKFAPCDRCSRAGERRSSPGDRMLQEIKYVKVAPPRFRPPRPRTAEKGEKRRKKADTLCPLGKKTYFCSRITTITLSCYQPTDFDKPIKSYSKK